MVSNEIFEIDELFLQSFEDIVKPFALEENAIQNNELDSFIFNADFIREIDSLVAETTQHRLISILRI